MSAQREKIGEMLGSASYDQDLDFVDLYVRYIHNEADEDERKSLELHYISKLYSYKSKLIHFLDTLKFDDLPDMVRYKVLGEYLMAGGKYIKGKEEDMGSKIANKLKLEVIPYLDNSLEDLSKSFSIKKTQQAFMLISLTFCLYLNSIELSNHPEKIYEGGQRVQIEYGDKFCYLVNDMGIFGLNTWLYGFFNGVYLVGVPSRYSGYDFMTNECPTKFAHHDYIHSHDVQKYGKHHDVARKLYIQILEDPEATQLQKELLILCLWVQVHEVRLNLGETLNDLLSFFTTTHFFYADVFSAPDFWEEYNRFRDLVLTQDLLDKFHSKIGNYKDNITPTTITEFRDFIDDQSQDLYSRIEMLARLIFFYYREYCKKYYFRV